VTVPRTHSIALLMSLTALLLGGASSFAGVGGASEGAGPTMGGVRAGEPAAGVVRLPNGTFDVVGHERMGGARLGQPSGGPLSTCTKTFRRTGFPDNVRVNTDCGGAGQQEELVSVNPTDP
jgi:hypothetical protein